MFVLGSFRPHQPASLDLVPEYVLLTKMFGTLAGIGGLLLLFHIVAIGYGVGVKKKEEEKSCKCEEEIVDLRKEVKGLEEKVVKEMRAREEMWLRDQVLKASWI